MLIIIAIEIYALILIRKWIRFYTGIEKFETRTAETKPSWWDRINAFKSIDSEGDIDTGHNYDGIRELDNITPPWFTAAFLGTILFAAVYLYRYHIAQSAPLQLKEYQNAMKIAEQEQALYLSEKEIRLMKIMWNYYLLVNMKKAKPFLKLHVQFVMEIKDKDWLAQI